MNIMETKIQAARSLREYFKEFVILALAISVVTLFKLNNDLNSFMTKEFINYNERMVTVIEKNTEALNRLNK